MILRLFPAEIEPGDVIVGGPYGPERTVLEAFRPSWTDGTRSLLHAEPRSEHEGWEFVGGCVDHYYDLDTPLAVRRDLTLRCQAAECPTL